MIVRPMQHGDLTGLQTVLESTQLFPSDMLPDMASGFLTGKDTALWLSCVDGASAVGFCYAAPEPMTEGTWNMLAIAVHPDRQNRGYGGALVHHLEKHLRDQRVRMLIVDTSGKPAFTRTRAFYRRHGYEEEARIRDFWAAGDDKVVFRKLLS